MREPSANRIGSVEPIPAWHCEACEPLKLSLYAWDAARALDLFEREGALPPQPSYGGFWSQALPESRRQVETPIGMDRVVLLHEFYM